MPINLDGERPLPAREILLILSFPEDIYPEKDKANVLYFFQELFFHSSINSLTTMHNHYDTPCTLRDPNYYPANGPKDAVHLPSLLQAQRT